MSGIAGIVRFDGTAVEPGWIELMTAALTHRGSDGITHTTDNGVAFGHCMLRTTPESLEEEQPLESADGSLVLVCDGRVDNWEELRSELLSMGARLHQRSDAELVLQAYQLWGPDCLRHIDGDFAFAIWNKQTRRLFCARDHIGNKPFNYYWDGSTLVFASELQAILALPFVPQKFNRGVLAEFLASQWYSKDETFWLGVQRLPAAHCITAEHSGPKISQYWSPELFTPLVYPRDEDYIEHYRSVLNDTVRRLSRSHQPLAVEVSGGLDSSSVFAVAEHLRRDGQLASPELFGYTMNFEGVADADEIAYCRAVGSHLNQSIVEVAPARPPLSWYRSRARQTQDFPTVPNTAMMGNLMQQASEADARVLLTGQGGDEWLGSGYAFYSEEMAEQRWRQLYRLFWRDTPENGLAWSTWYLIRYGLAPSLPLWLQQGLRWLRNSRAVGFDRSAWLQHDLREALKQQEKKQIVPRNMKLRWPGQRNELATLADPYSAYARESHEKFAASLGLELRSLFLTRAMVQLSFQMPKRLLFSMGINRYAHRQAMRGYLPEQVRLRDTKAEFSATFHHYLKDMKELLKFEIPGRKPHWVDPASIALFYDNIGSTQYDGWNDFMLWVLYGCDALSPGE